MAQEEKKELKPIVFRVQGRRPAPQEAEYAKSFTFGNGLPGGAELKEAVKWFFVGIGFGVVGFIIGRWVIKHFVGPGVLFFGYGLAYVAAPISLIFAVYSLLSLLRPAHKKKADAAMKWMWIVSVMGEDAVGERFGKLAYAKSTMKRVMPKETQFNPDMYGGYVTLLRNSMGEVADITASLLKADGWSEGGPLKTFTVQNETELMPDVKELQSVLTYRDRVTRQANNKTYYAETGILELQITQVYIRAGKYWFPYDVTPAFQVIGTQEPAEGTES